MGLVGLSIKKIESLGFPEDFTEEEKDMIFKLLGEGWTREELVFYNEIRTNLIDFKVICDINFINMLLPRYSQIIQSHNKDPLFLKLLHYLVKEYIEKKVDFILENYKSEVYGYSNIRIVYPKNSKNILEIHEGTGGIHQFFSIVI